jgi:hypothetical protein
MEIDLRDLQQRSNNEIESMIVELEGSDASRVANFAERFLASGKTPAPKPGWQRRVIGSGKAGAPRRH